MSHGGVEVAGTWKSRLCPISRCRAGAGVDPLADLCFKAAGIKARKRESRKKCGKSLRGFLAGLLFPAQCLRFLEPCVAGAALEEGLNLCFYYMQQN